MVKIKEIEDKFKEVTLKIIREVYKDELKESYNQALKEVALEICKKHNLGDIKCKDFINGYDTGIGRVIKIVEGLRKE